MAATMPLGYSVPSFGLAVACQGQRASGVLRYHPSPALTTRSQQAKPPGPFWQGRRA
jgi:hypothetical protein